MGNVRKGLIGFGALLLIIAFLSWRLEFSTPFFSAKAYSVVGVMIILAVLFGRFVAHWLMLLSLLPYGYGLILIIFVNDFDWGDVGAAFGFGTLSLVLGIILFLMGSESFHDHLREEHYQEQKLRNRRVVCVDCGNVLGLAKDYDRTPCWRCGCNRYDYE